MNRNQAQRASALFGAARSRPQRRNPLAPNAPRRANNAKGWPKAKDLGMARFDGRKCAPNAPPGGGRRGRRRQGQSARRGQNPTRQARPGAPNREASRAAQRRAVSPQPGGAVGELRSHRPCVLVFPGKNRAAQEPGLILGPRGAPPYLSAQAETRRFVERRPNSTKSEDRIGRSLEKTPKK